MSSMMELPGLDLDTIHTQLWLKASLGVSADEVQLKRVQLLNKCDINVQFPFV